MTIRNENGAGDITTVTVLGTGVLGSQIAYQTAYSGFEVTAYDISDDILASAKLRFQELAARYEREVDGAGGERARAALARIAYSSDLTEAVRDADLVIEAVPERLDLKRDVYSELAKAAPAKTIFATNSSTLLPSAMAEFTGRPERSSRCTSVTRYGSGTSPRSWAIPTPIPLSSGPSSTLRGGSGWSRSS